MFLLDFAGQTLINAVIIGFLLILLRNRF